MSTALATLRQDLHRETKSLQAVLPQGLDVNRFMRTVVNGIASHAQADQLLDADRQTLFRACSKAAADGLMLDGKEATLTAFYNKKKRVTEVVYMPMVQGLVKLARNSGEIKNIIAEVVYQNDQFQYRPGVDEQPMHAPDWFGERGDPVGAYAVVTTQDNEKIVTVMPKQRIMAIANTGRNAHQYNPDQGIHFGEWWKKTAIKNVLKYAPKSSYLESAMDHDNEQYKEDDQPEAPEPRDITPPKPNNRAAELEQLMQAAPAEQAQPKQAAQAVHPDTTPIEKNHDPMVVADIYSQLMEGAGSIEDLEQFYDEGIGRLRELYKHWKAAGDMDKANLCGDLSRTLQAVMEEQKAKLLTEAGA